jgi:hypothetical protein
MRKKKPTEILMAEMLESDVFHPQNRFHLSRDIQRIKFSQVQTIKFDIDMIYQSFCTFEKEYADWHKSAVLASGAEIRRLSKENALLRRKLKQAEKRGAAK